MRRLLIEGREYMELLFQGDVAPLTANLGATEFYRDGAGVIRLYTPHPENVSIHDVVEIGVKA